MQREIQRDRGVRSNRTFNAGMADIPLMPQGDVFQGRRHRHADKAGQTGEVLAQDRVALVRHGGTALLAGREELLGLQHFGALHVADFNGDVFDAAGDDAERCKEHGMAVAGDDLGADRLGDQAQHLTYMLFDRRIDIGKGANRARDCAGANFLPRGDQAGAATVHLGVEAGKGQTHGGGLGMNAVAAADADGVFMLKGPGLECRQNPVHRFQQQI